MATAEDRTIKCIDCGEEFLFTAGEQEFYREHKLDHLPTRCRKCREARKGHRSGAAPSGPGGHGRHSAVCAECGTETQVPFLPSGGRPVYCRSCFQAKKPASVRVGSAAAPRTGSAGDGHRTQGAVKWFNAAKGYGFIQTDEGEDIFVHFSAIESGGYRSLTGGDRVEFDVVDSTKGRQASKVVKI